MRKSLAEFEKNYIKATEIDSGVRKNNQLILPVFQKLISHSLKPLELILRFLTDTDIMAIACTCRTIYKYLYHHLRLVYSPLGFRLSRYLRPVVILKH